MAELVTLVAVSGAITAYFAGLTAIANITSAYQEYRRNHPRVNKTGPRSDYVQKHFGYNIKLLQQQNESYKDYTGLLPEICQGPKPSRFRRLSAKFRDSFRSSSSNLRDVPEAKLGGELKLTPIQKVPDTFKDNFVGLNTGKQPMYDIIKAENHWATIQDGSAGERNAAPTIAVVNWTTQVITVFIKNSEWERGMYFRNYQVLNSNLAHFAEEFQHHVVFTGVLKGGSLVGTNSPIFLAEDDRECTLKSTNSWKILGLRGDTGKEFLFLEMVRAALFGLIECLYEDPTLVNVDMRDGNGSGQEFVHVDVKQGTLSYKPDNIFSVFAFNSKDYSEERVLVG